MTENLYKQIKNLNILLIGDFFLDEYIYGTVERISPEAPVPILKVLRKTYNLGGAGNVMNNLINIGCKVTVFGNIGNDVPGKKVLSNLKKKNIDKDLFQVNKNVKTITKSRVVNKNQQIVRIDDEIIQNKINLSKNLRNKILKKFKKFSLVIISDYGKGFCSNEICKFIITAAKKYKIKVIVDPRKNFNDYEKYKYADFITPNLNEMKILFPKIKNETKDIFDCACRIIKKFNIKNVITTRSEKGISFTDGLKLININTIAKQVFDVSGAGDTVVSVFSVLIGLKKEISYSLRVSNMCAGKVISKIGTTPISNKEFRKILEL